MVMVVFLMVVFVMVVLVKVVIDRMRIIALITNMVYGKKSPIFTISKSYK